MGEALIVTAIIYLVPVHPLAFVIFQTISTAYNVYGHCGREFWPRGMASHGRRGKILRVNYQNR